MIFLAVKLVAVAVLLSGCASKLIVKGCEHVGQDVYKCQKVIGRDYK
jgi:hypothetical protein